MLTDLLPVLIPLLLLDILNPVLFALLLAGIGSGRPVVNSSLMLAGHTVAYFVVGIAIALGLDKVTGRLANPHAIDYVISMIVGLACIYAAYRSRNGTSSESKEAEGALTPFKSLSLGAVANFVGVPFAVTYFVAIEQILRANLSATESVVILAGYNLAYAAPFAMIPMLTASAGDRFKPMLEKINQVLIKLANFILPIILGLLGFVLIVDAVLYFGRGSGLY